MNNFIPPKNVLGTINVSPKDWADKYYIGEANFAIEKIGNNNFLNIWANSFHYELHNGQEVLVGDVGFEIMQPITKIFEKNEVVQIDFPDDLSKMENNWEEIYYSHFYQFGHLKISNWSIILTPTNGVYQIEVKGFITHDINMMDENHFFESKFETKMESKINSKWNWKYSSINPNAINLK